MNCLNWRMSQRTSTGALQETTQCFHGAPMEMKPQIIWLVINTGSHWGIKWLHFPIVDSWVIIIHGIVMSALIIPFSFMSQKKELEWFFETYFSFALNSRILKSSAHKSMFHSNRLAGRDLMECYPCFEGPLHLLMSNVSPFWSCSDIQVLRSL